MSLDFRKKGIPVLAFPHCDAVPASSYMIFRSNVKHATATILLHFSLSMDDLDGPYTLIAQYDPDNLACGSLGPATIPLPQCRLDELAREGNPQMRTLALTLKRAAPVWVLPDMKSSPQPGHEVAFNSIVALARATTLYMLFDFNWLHQDHHAALQRFVDHPAELKAHPVWRHLEATHRQEDWSVFEHVVPSGDDIAGEFPPQYAESQKGKRLRTVTPTPSTPPHKRTHLSAVNTHTSPTEKDSVATSSPKTLHSPGPPSPLFFPLDQTSAAPHTPTGRAAAAMYPPVDAATSPQQQQSLQSAMSALLPSLLSSLLPTMLPRLLTLQSPSPTPSLVDLPSQRDTPPPELSAIFRIINVSTAAHPGPSDALPAGVEIPFALPAAQPPPLSALGISVSEHVTRRIESALESLYAHTVSHANFLRGEADASFFDDREGERLAWQRTMEGAEDAFRERLEDAGVEKIERVEEALEYKEERVLEAVETAVAKTKRLKIEKDALEVKLEDLKREKKQLKEGKRELRRDIDDLRREKRDLRRDVRGLRRQKEELRDARKGKRRSRGSCSILRANSAMDSQDLDL